MNQLPAIALLVACAAAQGAPISGQGTWETTLQARDVDRDGTIDAYYDTALDITWSADPYLGLTIETDFTIDYGRDRFRERRAFGQRRVTEWLDYLNQTRYLGVNRWRLPRFVDVNADGCTKGVDCGQYHDVTLSEVAHMYAVTLGNLPNCGPPPGTCPQEGGGLTNVGPFIFPERRFGTAVWIEDPNPRVRALWIFTLATGLQKPDRLVTGGKAQVWAVLDGDIAEYRRRPPGPEPDAGDYTQLHCPGDVDLNNTPDVLAVTTGGRVIMRSLDGAVATRFALEHAMGLVDTAVTADIDGNGAPELVALGTSVAEVRDLLQGEAQSVVNFWSDLPSAQLQVIDDLDGNGYPEVARLALIVPFMPSADKRGRGVLQSRDLVTGAIGIRRSDRHNNPVNFVYAPRAPQTTGPLFGLIFASDRSFANAGIESRLWTTHVYQPYRYVRDRYFGGGFLPTQGVALPGAAGGGLPTVAVLGTGGGSTRDGVRLLSVVKEARSPFTSPPFMSFDDAVIRVGLGEEFTASQLLATPDFNGNGAPEFVVYEYETTGSRHRALINDGRTGERLGTVRFSEQLVGLDIAMCPDLNGNGSAEIALLGMRPADGGVRVIVKDGNTDELLGAVSLPTL